MPKKSTKGKASTRRKGSTKRKASMSPQGSKKKRKQRKAATPPKRKELVVVTAKHNEVGHDVIARCSEKNISMRRGTSSLAYLRGIIPDGVVFFVDQCCNDAGVCMWWKEYIQALHHHQGFRRGFAVVVDFGDHKTADLLKASGVKNVVFAYPSPSGDSPEAKRKWKLARNKFFRDLRKVIRFL